MDSEMKKILRKLGYVEWGVPGTILTLNLKAEYFNQIKAGTKTEEYRLCTDYWRKRLENRNYDAVCICLGYPKKR